MNVPPNLTVHVYGQCCHLDDTFPGVQHQEEEFKSLIHFFFLLLKIQLGRPAPLLLQLRNEHLAAQSRIVFDLRLSVSSNIRRRKPHIRWGSSRHKMRHKLYRWGHQKRDCMLPHPCGKVKYAIKGVRDPRNLKAIYLFRLSPISAIEIFGKENGC